MKKKYIYIFLVLFSSKCLLSLDNSVFHNYFNHFSGEKIVEFALMGQRCSGTNFIEHLILKNFPSYFFNDTVNSSNDYSKIPHKHHWPLAHKLSDGNSYSFLNKDNCLFILIVRDPYRWLQSLFLQRRLQPQHDRSSFYKFISVQFNYANKWLLINPLIKRKFSNILEARNFTLKNYLAIGNMVANFLVVRYEDVAKKPKKFIDFMASYFHLKKNNNFVPVTKYKGKEQHNFSPKKYKEISSSNIRFINDALDWEIENIMGYFSKKP